MRNANAVALDGAGNLYIADTANNRVRRVNAADGVITTYAGNGTGGYSGDGGAADMASLWTPYGVATDAAVITSYSIHYTKLYDVCIQS